MAQGNGFLYAEFADELMRGTLDLDGGHTLKMALVHGYNPNVDTHNVWADVSSAEVAGTNYTAGGKALTTVTVTKTAANSWATTWAASTAYKLGDIVRPTSGNGYVYRCTVAGTSAGSEPTWPTTIGGTVADSGVTWQNAGKWLVKLSCDTITWTSLLLTTPANATPSHAVLYDDSHASDSLIGYWEVTTVTNGGDYGLTLPAAGLLTLT